MPTAVAPGSHYVGSTCVSSAARSANEHAGAEGHLAAGLAVGNGIMERALVEANALEAEGRMREASEVLASAMERMKVAQEGGPATGRS